MKMVLCKICTKLAVAVLSLAIGLSAFAGEIVGKVTKVSDGDTIWMATDSGREKVRMDRIDAPEKDQPFGKEASEMLSGKIYGKVVKVEYEKRDQYGRVLGIVFDGTNDVNLAMVREGGAWHYRYFDKTLAYDEAEDEARAAKRGLWALPNPINPYDWRRRNSVEQFKLGKMYCSGEGEVALTIKTIAGLKYSLVRGAEIGAITDTVVEPTIATEAEMTLKDENPPPGNAFYKVGVGK